MCVETQAHRYRRIQSWTCRLSAILLLAAPFALAMPSARAETTEVKVGAGFGIHYLPFYVMEKEQLVEKRAKAAGLTLKASYLRFSGGAALNDALLSGAVDFIGSGVGPFAILWDKTKGKLNVKAVAAMGDVPPILLTNDPKIQSIKDIKEGDRIALPAVKSSMQATLLQMAAANTFGEANYAKLDVFTVSMPHGEATAALTGTSGLANLHFSVPPYATLEKRNPAVRQILSATEIVGGPMSLNLVSCTERFYKDNPVVTKIFVDALEEANQIINTNRPLAAGIYVDGDKNSEANANLIEEVLSDPALNFTIVPHGVGPFISFMYRTGIIKNDPGTWKGVFFPIAENLPGN